MKRLIWLPFYIAHSQASMKDDIENSRLLINKPILLEDRINETNNNLINSYNNKLNINIKYFEHGIIKYYYGIIKKLDTINMYLVINNKRLYFKNILKIDIQD